MLGEFLYYRGFDGILLRCSEWEDSQTTISCTHDGICGGQFSGKTISKWLMYMGYYWPTMECDYVDYVKKYFKC